MDKYRLSDAPRVFHLQQDGIRRTVMLYQIVALRDFADVGRGSTGGWIEDERALSQSGNCWIYDTNSMVFDDARVDGDARLTQTCLISSGARISGSAWIDDAVISHGAAIGDNVTVQNSRVSGPCRLADHAQILDQCDIIALAGMTADVSLPLQIYGRARVSRSRVVHQAQIYGDAVVDNAFIEHRAEIFDYARLEGNEVNNVWVCDCAKVFGRARIVAGHESDAIPTLRYSTQVSGDALVEGNCVLKHHVAVMGNARLRGGPLLLDDRVRISGDALLGGDVVICQEVDISGEAVIEASGGEQIILHGPRVMGGRERITRTPLPGSG
ncbi:YdcK family protein [uncultured Pluralibacter sp.]|uniref:YdcK family protein n=1 Tax=uncultured Pluralibacter sp. TaxID=1490864 RepID=UPI00262D6AE4|nr:YdcK family protein [uncultured Pluralibacter sp.]